MPTENQKVVVLITAPSAEVGHQIASALVESRLAACVNILSPVRSIYRWQGQVMDEQEVLLLVKTRASLVESQLIPAVRRLHPYETPEVIALTVTAGLPEYLAWLEAETE